MAVTLKDGTRFRVTREPLGLRMEFARKAPDGTLQTIAGYVDNEELTAARGGPMAVLRWYRRTLLDNMRAFGGRMELKKGGRWAG